MLEGRAVRGPEGVLRARLGNLGREGAGAHAPSRGHLWRGRGRALRITIDSFPSNDFGVVEGTVKSFGSDALPPDEQHKTYRFPAMIALNTQQLKLKSGKSLPLQVGMSLTANIKLRKVTWLQLLLGEFKDKTDSLKQF